METKALAMVYALQIFLALPIKQHVYFLCGPYGFNKLNQQAIGFWQVS